MILPKEGSVGDATEQAEESQVEDDHADDCGDTKQRVFHGIDLKGRGGSHEIGRR